MLPCAKMDDCVRFAACGVTKCFCMKYSTYALQQVHYRASSKSVKGAASTCRKSFTRVLDGRLFVVVILFLGDSG